MDGIDQLLAMTDHMNGASLANVIRWGEGEEYSSDAGLGMSAELGQISLRDHLRRICLQLSLDMPTEDERRILEAWPRYEGSRDPVMLGGEVDGLAGRVSIIEFYDGGVCNVYSSTEQVDDHVHLAPGERVGRPAVRAADGEPLEPGQAVWHEDGTELRVLGFEHEEDGERIVRVEYVGGPTEWSEVRSLSLTHRRPVLDAYGVPVKVGDHGWWLDEPETEIVVERIDPDECAQLTVRDARGHGDTICASEFTRTKPEPPDSWERIEGDARKLATDYWGCEGADCDDCPAKVDGRTPCERYGTGGRCGYAMRLDLVRRCKALAGEA